MSDGGMNTLRFLRIATIGLLATGLLAATASFGETPMTSSAKNQYFVYFGTYTSGKSKGIYVSRFDLATGKLGAPELAAETKNPSFIAIHPNHRFLYAGGEFTSEGGKKGGGVSAFAIEPASGKLTRLNQQPAGAGGAPCHVNVDKAGKYVLAANYGTGSAVVLAIKKDGSLGENTAFVQHTGSSVNPKRQAGPHAHAINLDAANRFAFVPDLGLDKVMIYRFDTAKGTLTPNEPAFGTVTPGSGPRHIAFLPNGRFAYVINEMACTMTAFSYDAKRGALKELQSLSTLPAGESVQPGYSTAEVLAHPSGKFIYGSNRGHDTIVIYAVDAKSGKLTLVGHESTQGKVPRCFGIDPMGAFLIAANQSSDNVTVFRIDQKSGKLTPTGQSIEVGAPVCVMFMPVK
jgi:6-phosphogluconolactonase